MTSTGCSSQKGDVEAHPSLKNPMSFALWDFLQQSTAQISKKTSRKYIALLVYGVLIVAWPRPVDKYINLVALSEELGLTLPYVIIRKAFFAINIDRWIPSLMSVAEKAELLLKNDNSQQRGDHIYRPSIRGLGCTQRLFCDPRELSSKDQRRPPTPRTSGRISASSRDQCAFIAMLPLSEPHEPLPLASRSIYLLLYLQ